MTFSFLFIYKCDPKIVKVTRIKNNRAGGAFRFFDSVLPISASRTASFATDKCCFLQTYLPFYFKWNLD